MLWEGTLIIQYISRLEPFLGVKSLNFNIFFFIFFILFFFFGGGWGVGGFRKLNIFGVGGGVVYDELWVF